MKKVFNASILAASVALTFGANAADLSVANPASVTVEAAAAGVAVPAGAQTIRVLNREQLVPGDVITLSFPIGTASTADLTNAAEFEIEYGNGTFTFTNVAWDAGTATVAPTLSLEVELGNPVIADSAFDVMFKGTTFTAKAGNVTYKAVDGTSGDVKDTGGNNSAALTTSLVQEVASVSKKFNGFVNRTNRHQFVADKGNVVAEISVAQPTADVPAVAVGAGNVVVLTAVKGLADLTSVRISDCPNPATAAAADCTGDGGLASTTLVDVAAAAFTCSTAGVDCLKDTATFGVNALAGVLPAVASGKEGTWYVSVTPGASGTDIPLTTFTATRSVEYTSAGDNPEFDYFKDSDIGKFQLDASVVNVPYLPVGYGFSPNIEISNMGAAGEIMLEGHDNKGNQFPAYLLSKKTAANGLMTVTEKDIEEAFGLAPESRTKVSVTLIIDADADDISLAPYYRQNESRINIISDQYKGVE